MTKDWKTLPYDLDLVQGARNAAIVCLRVQPGERVVLITDRQCLPIGAALLEQFAAVGADVIPFVLEELITRGG